MKPQDSYPSTAIVIVNWNDETTTAAALESLRMADLYGARIILVDSASNDGSDLNLQRRFPEVELLRLPENRGYAGGCNAGIRRALELDCEAVLVMNYDVIVAPDFLRYLLEKCQDRTVGLVGGKIYLPGSPARFQSAGAFINYWTGETWNRFQGEVDVGQAEAESEPDYLLGAVFLLTRRLIETIGAFDQRLFMYYEETDLCVRARSAGFRVIYTPASRVWHCEKPRPGSSKPALQQFYMLRNRIIFMRRHAPYKNLLVFCAYFFGYRLPKEALRCLAGRAGTLRRLFQAVAEGWRFPIDSGVYL